YEQCLAANRLKSEFIASMSHELRTPLHIMMGYTEMLLDGNPGRTSAERDQMVLRIREASHGLLQLVNGVLDLRKLESGRVPLEIEPVQLTLFLAHFQRRERIPVAPNVTLRRGIDPALPELETDVAKLRIILDTLVNTEIKYTRNRTITVSASDAPGEGYPPRGRAARAATGGPSSRGATRRAARPLPADVRATLETDDGTLVLLRYGGRVDASRGLGDAPIYAAPQFDTGDERYAWLKPRPGDRQGHAQRQPPRYEIYEVR